MPQQHQRSCGVDIVVVVVHAAKSSMDSGEHGKQVVLGRRRRGEPAEHAVAGLGLRPRERPIGGEGMQVHEQAEPLV